MKQTSYSLSRGMDINGYQLLEQCGKPGGYGVVWCARNLNSSNGMPEKVAIKFFDPKGEHGIGIDELYDRFCSGALILKKLSRDTHQIVKVYEVNESAVPPYYVMEYLEDGHLKYDNDIPKLDRLELAIRLVKAVAFLHQHHKPIVHRDLKPENILLRREGNDLYPILSDFDTVKEFNLKQVDDSICIPHSWQAPEVQVGIDGVPICHKYTPTQDVYPLGMIAAYILTGIDPARLKKDWALTAQRGTPIEEQAAYYRSRLQTELNRLNLGAITDVILKALAYPQDNRYVDANAFYEALIQASNIPTRVQQLGHQRPSSDHLHTITTYLILTLAGGLIGQYLAFSLSHALGNAIGANLITGSLMGLGLGCSQWYFIRRYRSVPSWIVVTVCASGLGNYTGMLLGASIDWLLLGNHALALGLTGALLGFVQGISQWLIIRVSIKNSYQWIFITTIGWALGNYFAALINTRSNSWGLGGFNGWAIATFCVVLLQALWVGVRAFSSQESSSNSGNRLD